MVYFTWVFTYPTSGITSFRLGAMSGSCTFPTSTRTVPFYQNGATFKLIISSDGTVDVEKISGTTPSGQTVGFNGSYSLYHNAFYSSAMSGTFTRDCPSGQIGSSVSYSIFPYRFRSFISQADADNQATAAFNTEGQAYANQNGTCSVPCTFTPESGISFYTSTVSEDGSQGSFNFVFQAPTNNYGMGTLGTIGGACVPSSNQYRTITDGATPSRTWSVSIYTTGQVVIHLSSGAAPGTSGPPIVIQGTYNL